MTKQPASLTPPPQGCADWLAELKTRIHSAQQRAVLAVNRELVQLYWHIGQDILARQPLHESPRRLYLQPRAACGIVNPRNRSSYGCCLRLTVHPDPQRRLAARFVQRLPIALTFIARKDFEQVLRGLTHAN